MQRVKSRAQRGSDNEKSHEYLCGDVMLKLAQLLDVRRPKLELLFGCIWIRHFYPVKPQAARHKMTLARSQTRRHLQQQVSRRCRPQ